MTRRRTSYGAPDVVHVKRTSDPDWYEVRSPYDRECLDDLRRTCPPSFRQWDRDRKVWRIHRFYLYDVLGTFADYDYIIRDDSGLGEEPDYAALYVTPDAPDAVVHAAYRALAKILHPDVGGDAQAFVRVQAAYDAICAQRAQSREE
jgi:hypothetical protein